MRRVISSERVGEMSVASNECLIFPIDEGVDVSDKLETGWVMNTHVNDHFSVPLLGVELDYPTFGQEG